MAQYTAISQVPKGWRKIGYGSLTLPQIQALVDAAEAASKNEGIPFAVAHTQVRVEFEATHQVVNGFWVKQGDSKA